MSESLPTNTAAGFARSIAVVFFVAAALGFALSDARLSTWHALLPFFEWMETTWFGVIGQTWGAAFALVEAVHLLAMAVLGGAVLVSDGRLLGLLFTEVPARTVIDNAHTLFKISLGVVIFTGVFMACGVAIKIYYLPVYWYKMLALAVGVLFAFLIRQPLLAADIEAVQPWVLRVVAASSIMIWFTVAACGRWIGFSG